jgi:hypothetical protein
MSTGISIMGSDLIDKIQLTASRCNHHPGFHRPESVEFLSGDSYRALSGRVYAVGLGLSLTQEVLAPDDVLIHFSEVVTERIGF